MRASTLPRRESELRATSTDVVEVTSLIAIVPDPSVTSMELRFDRTIAALLAGFKPYQLVLGPVASWNVDGAGNVRRQDQAQAGEGSLKEPGVLVLRKADALIKQPACRHLARRPPAAPYDYAVVFLVPETAVCRSAPFLLRKAFSSPPGSIQRRGSTGFASSVAARRPIRAARHRTGPAYSASLEPLATALTNLSLFAGAPTRFTPDMQWSPR
ncbi:MAG: hypothetical protein U0610_07425 [bacterium]